MKLLFLTLLIYTTVLTGCDNPTPSSPAAIDPPESKSTQPMMGSGDLAEINNRGMLRLIAPRFDSTGAFPSNGFSTAEYHRIAEQFAEHLGLRSQWLFVDGFSELIPALIEGKGDLIITNLTITSTRAKQVLFTQPINTIDEVLVTTKGAALNTINDLDTMTVSIPKGTSYIDSLEALKEKHSLSFSVDLLPSSMSDTELVNAIAQNTIQSTVLDSDVAQRLLPDYPTLSSPLVIRKNQGIAWATRKDSPELLQQLNQYLISHHIQTTTHTTEQRRWEAIKQSGRLRMLTLNNPASYFMWKGELMGFDKDLLSNFAKEHKLHLTVIIKDSIPELISALHNGEGDVIAASITQSEKRENLGVVFSTPYLITEEQVIGLASGPKAASPSDLANRIIGVNPNTVFYDYLVALKNSGTPLTIKEYPGISTENLIAKLYEGEFDFTMADSHLAAIESAYRDNLQVAFTTEKPGHIAWGLRQNQPDLLNKLNTFIKKEYRGLYYNVTYNKYFKNSRRMKAHKANRISSDGKLSPYDDTIKEVASAYGMDWRLIVSQMYQESKFNPNALSFAGAQGLMQVMPRTAKELGIEDVKDPVSGIKAGVAYMDWLKGRFPDKLNLQERLYFTLASYNAGAGHVRDARKLAKQLGYDHDKWFDHTEKAMLLLSRPEHYKHANYGYVRGSEPVHYVKHIRARYLGYLHSQTNTPSKINP